MTAPNTQVAPDSQIALEGQTTLDIQALVDQEPALNRYPGINLDILASLLNEVNNDVIFDIQPLSIDNSPAKPSPSISYGVRTIIDKAPKVAKSKAFKPLGVMNPITSDLVNVSIKVVMFNII